VSLALVGDKAHEIHRRVGRNLLLFQALEVNLKLSLPYMLEPGKDRTDAEIRDRNLEMKQWTLGQLLGEWVRCSETSAEFWVLEPSEVVKQRNDLVHQFFCVPEIDHLSPNAFDHAVAYLDRQFEMVQEIHAVVSALGLMMMRQILAAKPHRTAEEESWLAALKLATVPGVEMVDHTQSPPTGWATTRIVQLLKRAEQETEAVDGYTLLSRAGALLRREDPLAHPKMYGYKRLSEVLEVCQLFEVIRRPSSTDGESGGAQVLYRTHRSAPNAKGI
jgi:hypothetical protein